MFCDIVAILTLHASLVLKYELQRSGGRAYWGWGGG